jgi:leucyl aminopeptidase
MILQYKPERPINAEPYVIVGKGVTYDTGGHSLKKTQDSMDYMKCDMAGAAAVAGLFKAVAESKLPVHLIGLIPATDNRLSAAAYSPGDIIKMHNGKTVEVMNTDAEGRLILADALSYSNQYKPKLVFTIATLTGSASVAIGTFALVAMGNAEIDEMSELRKAGEITSERIAEFPFWDEYFDSLKSEVADMKNVGNGNAGAIVGGKFLEKFTEHPFIHLDIAGPSFLKKTDSYRGIGATGIGIRLLYHYFKKKCR